MGRLFQPEKVSREGREKGLEGREMLFCLLYVQPE